MITRCRVADSFIVKTRDLHLCSPARAHDQYTRLPISLFFVYVKWPTFNLRLPRHPSMYKNMSEIMHKTSIRME